MNNIKTGQVVLYTKEALDIIRKNIKTLDCNRPEASALRLPEIVKRWTTNDLVIGMHGFFQDDETLERAKKHKIDRKQIEKYDFELVERLNKL